MRFHSLLTSATSTLAVGLASFSTAAYAQSTGSVDFEESEIVVSGAYVRDVAGVKLPDTPKAKQVLTQEIISAQSPGQTINDTINLIPGVSFQNNDPYGSAGGNLNIRGFDDTRISQTFDGIPLNDTGGYALYSNQQLDPEVIDQAELAELSGQLDQLFPLRHRDEVGGAVRALLQTRDALVHHVVGLGLRDRRDETPARQQTLKAVVREDALGAGKPDRCTRANDT